MTNHHRRSIRLKDHDYTQPGAYFVTICIENRECMFEDSILRGIAQEVWDSLPGKFPGIALDEFVIMPNHIHFIIWLGHAEVGAGLAPALGWAPARGAPTPGAQTNAGAPLGAVVGAFKSLVFKQYLDWIESNDPSRRAKLWQRNYYEHIIRNDRELQAIRQYIIENPVNWEMDGDNPNNSLEQHGA